MEFDSFYIKFGGLSDDGFHDAIVIVGYSDDTGLNRSDIEIPVRLEANLDETLRQLREQAKVLALDNLRKAVKLLELNSADQLHLKAQDAVSEKRDAAALTLDKSILNIGNNFTSK